MESTDPTFKVVLMGDSGVGKTSIVLQFSEHVFREITRPTVGSGCVNKKVMTQKGLCSLMIWDTAGEERYRSVTSLYSQGANAFIIVYDVTDESTFESIPDWIETFQQTADDDSLVYIIANKIDITNRAVSDVRAFEWARQHNYPYFEVSARTGENVDLVFDDVAEKVMNNQVKQDSVVNPILAESKSNEQQCC